MKYVRPSLAGIALAAVLVQPAKADCIASTLLPFNAWQAADAYTISKTRWEGMPNYDREVPLCDHGLVKEIACQGALYVALRKLERPSKLTCIMNLVVTAALTIHTSKSFAIQLFSIKT